ncbi:MAG: hypothetical protein PHY92_05480 [Alphaproteobacteria bacterium]|nr:hypothetical protein [Alphaproteobacteria bacterium]
MNKFTMILSALLTLTLIAFIAPSIFAMNRGKMLRNIALWLAIALGLALVYQTFGPGKNQTLPAQSTSQNGDGSNQPDSGSQDDGAQGYTPPGE